MGPRSADSLGSLRALIASRYGCAPEEIRLSRIRGGGLCGELARVRLPGAAGAASLLVVKRLSGIDVRETGAYEALARAGLSHIAPRLVGTEEDREAHYLYLEYVSRWKLWPWREEAWAASVLETLARLHAAPAAGEDWHPRWDYESYLRASAEYTLDVLRTAAVSLDDARLRGGLRSVRALAARLGQMRAVLLEHPVFLHGDVHPGNVRLRTSPAGKSPVLLDWGRARLGSRFEDVASWLQCLRFYEPAAARAHDRLLAAYLRAAGLADRIEPSHRREYWLAAGCNALAGALAVHLQGALSNGSGLARAYALGAAYDWLRIVRRAAAYLDASDGRAGTA